MKRVSVIKNISQITFGLLTIALSGLAGWSSANAAATDISTAPVFTTTANTAKVKPNVMFVLDDSGSMGWRVMPDEAWDFNNSKGEISSQCNGVFYNPSVTYLPPKLADGSDYPNSTWPNAPVNGFNLGEGTANLTTQFWWYYNSDSSTANYFAYNGGQTLATQKTYSNAASTFYQECDQARNTTSASWTPTTVSATSGIGGTDERINFANWFSYYRTRMLTMKTSAGRAFNQLDDEFRIGYSSLNNSGPTNDFLNINDFDATQKTNWYAKLYDAVPNNSTPLRESLAEAGLVYSGRATTINGVAVIDPVQFACQQNYTILSTDGYWNGNDGFKIDGSDVDNQDDLLPIPYNDGAFFSKTIVTPYVTTEDRETQDAGYTTTETYQDTTKSIGLACSTPDVSTPPANTASAPILVRNNKTFLGAVGNSTGNPAPNGANNLCENLSGDAWFCRDSNKESNPFNQVAVTDSTSGVTWHLVTSGASATASCVTSEEAWNFRYESDNGVCPSTVVPGITGNEVTLSPSTYSRDITGRSHNIVNRYTATQTTTQNVTPTTAGAIGPLTPATLAFVFDSEISNVNTAGTASIFTTPVAGAVTTSCVATADLPTPGTTTALISSVDSGGAPVGPTVVATTGPTVGTPVETVNSLTAGTTDTLADVAAYYYNTNLREWDGTGAMPAYCVGPIPAGETTASNLCLPNKVPVNGKDTEESQHMTTFTLGLGAQGDMVFTPDYETNVAGDYDHIAQGKTKSATTCSWADALTVTGGRCNWPVPVSNNPTTIDDLWHSAINGHGNYFNATDADSLATALTSSLNVIVNTPQPGTASVAATTNPQITASNNYRFSSYFKSVEWTGELIRQPINLLSGASPLYNHNNPDPATYDWSAQTQLDNRGYTSRVIYTKSEGSNARLAFTWANLSATQQAYFQVPHITTAPPAFPNPLTGLSQFCTGATCLTPALQALAEGEPLVNFIRGDRSNEDSTTPVATTYFRKRVNVLGDIISAEPIYVGPPSRDYSDTGYSTFRTSNASRKDLVYAASNDGMLHAFDVDTGDEDWAYIPGFVLPRLYTLADKDYENKHQYFVEGTPTTGDVYDATANTWKTILVGGLNAGGVGYYALDITDPADPKVLWEFTDTDMGYTFGNPNIVKLDNGKWVVTFTSGYNNCPTSGDVNCAKNAIGDGQGHMYVIDAVSGSLVALQSNISTGEGTATIPSGLSKSLVISLAGDGIVRSSYGGDLFGNLWRFDIGSGGYTKYLIATLKDAGGNAQPITAAPEAAKLDGNAVIYIGTGRYLGNGDVDFTSTQSFYAIKDRGVSYGNPRSNANFVKFTASSAFCPASAPISICNPGAPIRSLTQVSGNTNDSLQTLDGWIVDFPVGEITFTKPLIAGGTIAFTTSLPKATSTEVCGSPTGDDAQSFLWQLNFVDGRVIGAYNVAAAYLGTGISTRPKFMGLPGGNNKIVTKTSGGLDTINDLKTPPGSVSAKRNSWKELLEDQ